jgi:hypothetical protein
MTYIITQEGTLRHSKVTAASKALAMVKYTNKHWKSCSGPEMGKDGLWYVYNNQNDKIKFQVW